MPTALADASPLPRFWYLHRVAFVWLIFISRPVAGKSTPHFNVADPGTDVANGENTRRVLQGLEGAHNESSCWIGGHDQRYSGLSATAMAQRLDELGVVSLPHPVPEHHLGRQKSTHNHDWPLPDGPGVGSPRRQQRQKRCAFGCCDGGALQESWSINNARPALSERFN